jgi:hypothetical protein
MVVTVSGNPVLKPTWSSNPKELWYAGYPAWEQPVTGKVNGIDVCQNLQGTYGVEADVWVTPNVTGISLLSVHRQSVETGISDSVVAFGVFTNDRVELMVRNNGKDTKIPCISGLWKSGQFNKLTFIINGDDGTVLPFINGQFAVENPDMIPKVRVDGGYKGAFNDAHGGLQRSITDQKDALPQGTMVIDGNFRVFRVK